MIVKKLSIAAVGVCAGVSALYAATVSTTATTKVTTSSVATVISKVLMPMMAVSKSGTPASVPAPAAPAIDQNTIGMNVGGIAFYSRVDPFLDLVKTAGDWSSDNGAPVTLDASGQPTGLPAGAKDIRIPIYIGADLAHDQNRAIRVTWDGDATIGSTAKSGYVKNGETFTPIKGTYYGVFVITNLNPARPFRNFHVVRADQAKAFDSGEIFNPDFLAKEKPWSTLRFMDWNNTNGNTVVRWADRVKPDRMTWTTGTGVPIEIEVALANRVHADPWINVPAMADDDYVRQLVTYVRDHLDPTLKLHLEYSNEMWNYGFGQTGWALNQAKKLWSTVADIGNLDWYGYRSAQVSAIARGIYGSQADQRLSMVISTQTAWMGLENYVWRGVSRAGIAAPHFDEWAITTYWGWSLASNDDQDHAKVMSWVRGGAAGLNAAFQEIEHGGLLKIDASLDAQKPIYAYQAKVAADHKLKLVAYEGSFGTTAWQMPMADQDAVVAFYAKLQADPRMGKLYGRMADDFFAAGGKRLTVFNDIGAASKWGTWGTTDDLYTPSVRWDALVTRSKK